MLTRHRKPPPAPGLTRSVLALVALLGCLAGSAAEASLTEYQVKSLFLLNFAKYVDWPTNAFAATNAPIVVAVSGEGKFGDEFAKVVKGKSVDGRPILLRPLQPTGDFTNCHILFIAASEKPRLAEILGRAKGLPVLTVGEADQFMEQGGVINFVKKEGRVRLEINLDAARQAGLRISSKLLNVADVVKGKAN